MGLLDGISQVIECIASIREALISRMDFYGIPYDVNGCREAAMNNAAVKPEEVDDNTNPYRTDWVNPEGDIFLGYKVSHARDRTLTLSSRQPDPSSGVRTSKSSGLGVQRALALLR